MDVLQKWKVRIDDEIAITSQALISETVYEILESNEVESEDNDSDTESKVVMQVEVLISYIS